MQENLATGAEHLFLQQDDVCVTSQRFIVPGRTFAMHMISSVAAHEIRPARFRPGSLMVIGGFAFVAMMVGGVPGAAVAGLIVAALGGLWWTRQRSKYAVLVTTAGADQQALIDSDRERISAVVEALNQAIVSRH